jgi:hypothetical protein
MELEMERLKIEKEKLENERLLLQLDRARDEESHREKMKGEAAMQKRVQEETLKNLARMNAMNVMYQQHRHDEGNTGESGPPNGRSSGPSNGRSSNHSDISNSGSSHSKEHMKNRSSPATPLKTPPLTKSREMPRQCRQEQQELTAMFSTMQATGDDTRESESDNDNKGGATAAKAAPSPLHRKGTSAASSDRKKRGDKGDKRARATTSSDVTEMSSKELVMLAAKTESKLKLLLKESMKDFQRKLDDFNDACQNVMLGHAPEHTRHMDIDDPFVQDKRKVRLTLQEIYEELLCKHIDIAQAKNVEKHVWSLIYKEIDEPQAHNRELKTAEDTFRERGDDKSLHLVRTEQGKQRQILRQAIADGLQFCQRILANLWSLMEDATPDRQKTLVKSLQKLCIAMGDLHRYKAQHGPASTSSQSRSGEQGSSLTKAARLQAGAFYEKAKLIEPYKGKPQNQLGVISLQNGDLLSSAYHYCRAISAVEPFPSQQNLLQLFAKCQTALTTKYPSMVGSEGTGGGSGWRQNRHHNNQKKALSWEEVELRLVVLTGINYTQINESGFGKELEKFLWDFPKLLQEAVMNLQEFHSRFLAEGEAGTEDNASVVNSLKMRILKIMLLCIFNLRFNHSQRQKDKSRQENSNNATTAAPDWHSEEWAEGSSSSQNAFSLFFNVLSILMEFVVRNECHCKNIATSKRVKGDVPSCETFTNFGSCGFGYPLSLALPALDLGFFWLSSYVTDQAASLPGFCSEHLTPFRDVLSRSIPESCGNGGGGLRQCKHVDSVYRMFGDEFSSMPEDGAYDSSDVLLSSLTGVSRERFVKPLDSIDIQLAGSFPEKALLLSSYGGFPLQSDVEVEGFEPLERVFWKVAGMSQPNDANIVSQMQDHAGMVKIMSSDLDKSKINCIAIERVVLSLRVLHTFELLTWEEGRSSGEDAWDMELRVGNAENGVPPMLQHEDAIPPLLRSKSPDLAACDQHHISLEEAQVRPEFVSANCQNGIPPLLRDDLPVVPSVETGPHDAVSAIKNPGMLPELSLAKLASASMEQRTNMLGERLYPLIKGRQPDLAGKITGMLLEMANAELLNLLESPPALDSRIQEALEALRQHQSPPSLINSKSGASGQDGSAPRPEMVPTSLQTSALGCPDDAQASEAVPSARGEPCGNAGGEMFVEAKAEEDTTTRGVLSIGASAMDGLMQEMSKKDRRKKDDERKRVQSQRNAHSEKVPKNTGGGGGGELHVPSSHGIQSPTCSDLFPLIVIDAPNVGMKHGRNKTFSCKGIKLAIQFYKVRGHRVVCFMPEYYLSYENVSDKRRMLNAGMQHANTPKSLAVYFFGVCSFVPLQV